VAVAGPESPAGFATRADWQAGVKGAIGRAAAVLVPPGWTVLLDGRRQFRLAQRTPRSFARPM
jgi:DeoR/GlpR family transcriptional regulator of sugar metabolism